MTTPAGRNIDRAAGAAAATSLAGRVGRIVATVVRRVVVDQVRTGRLRREDWPPGLTPVVVIALVVYAVALGLVLAARWLRATLPTASYGGFPTVLTPLMVILVVVVCALVTTASLHGPMLLRLVGLLLPLVLLLAWMSLITDVAGIGWPLLCWLVLAGFAGWRWFCTFAWWEYVVVQLVIAAGAAVALGLGWQTNQARGYGDPGSLVLAGTEALAFVALPTTMAAGMALSEVALTTSVWLVEVTSVQTRHRATRIGLLAALAVVAMSSVVWSAWRASLPWPQHLLDLAMMAGIGLVSWLSWLAVDRIADRSQARLAGVARSEGWPAADTRLHQLVEPSRPVALAAAIVFLLPTGILLVALPVRSGLGNLAGAWHLTGGVGWRVLTSLTHLTNSTVRAVGFGLAAVTALLAAIVAARATRRGRAELWAIIAIVCAATCSGYAGWLPVSLGSSLADLSALAVLLTLALLALWRVSGRLTERRAEAIAVALLLALAVSHRELLADPLGLVLGGTGGAMVVLGLVWNLLTGAEDANQDSRRFPRPARALALAASFALAMVVVAGDALLVVDQLHLDEFVTFGSDILGTALVLAGLCAVVAAARRDEEIIEPGSVAARGDPATRSVGGYHTGDQAD